MAENQNSPPHQTFPSQAAPQPDGHAESATPVRSSGRGFAAMDPERQREIARKGGRSVPDEKRSFSQNRELAAAAGRKGGQESGGNFANDRERAAAAGRKGGQH
jgi:general stress protein YciG